MPTTVADMEATVLELCGLVAHDVGLYLRALDSGGNKITPVVRNGLLKGFVVVRATPADPMVLVDSDLAMLSASALDRIIDEAELFTLQQCLKGWYRISREHQEALTQSPMSGGWLVDEREGIKARVRDLRVDLREPFREPTDPIVVGHRDWVHPSRDPSWPYGSCDGWWSGEGWWP